MATTQQTGPRLTITASCEGCAYARGGETHWTRCEHPSLNTVECFPTGEPTPAWCPELPAARLALARSVGAEPLALPLPGDAPVNPKPATWDDGERR